MSLAAAAPRRAPVETPSALAAGRHLEIAPTRAQRRARPRLIHVIVTLGGIGVILLAQLMLSILLAQGAYQVHTLQGRQLDLQRTQSALSEQLDQLASPQYLAANAEKLGMVESGNPAYLDLATGAVSGAPTAASGTLVGSQGDLVPNSLIAQDPLVAASPTAGTTAGGGDAALPNGVIPSPTTH